MPFELLPGFDSLRDIVNDRVIGERIPVVDTAIQQALGSHNQVTQSLTSLFANLTTDFKRRYRTPVANKLQPLDETGRARPLKMAGFYDIATPIKSGGTAFGLTSLAAAKQTIQDVNDRLFLAFDADLRWTRDQLLGALLTNVQYLFTDPEHGDLTILPLANNDGQVYLIHHGNEQGETANHFRTITALNDANNPFFTIYTDLTKRPENAGGGKVIAFFNANLEDEVRALSSFIEKEDEDVRQSITSDVLIGSLPVDVPGEIIGKANRCWLVRWDAMPDNYILSVITSGDRALNQREHPEPELKGFTAVADRIDHPYLERQYQRHTGFGAQNRVNAMVYHVTGGAYTIPAGLQQPFA